MQRVKTATFIGLVPSHRRQPGLYQFLKLLRHRVTLQSPARSRLRRRATALLRKRLQQPPPPRMCQRKEHRVRIQRGFLDHWQSRLGHLGHAADSASRRFDKQAWISISCLRRLQNAKNEAILPRNRLPAGKTILESCQRRLGTGRTILQSAGGRVVTGRTILQLASRRLLAGRTILQSR